MPSNFTAPDDMDYIEKNAGRFGWGSLTFDQLIKQFDVARFPDYDNMAEPYIGHIFMSRPDINLGNGNLEVLRNHPMTAMFVNDAYGLELLKSLSGMASNVWMPIITNRAMTYTVSDFAIKTVEKGNTYYGHVLKYGKHSEDHKVGGTISIDFRSDRQLAILKMMYIWMAYIYIISKTGEVVPKSLYEETGILDYAASIYYIVTKRNMRDIVYAEKLVGVFPINLPFSMLSYNDGMIIQDQLTIDFAYGIKCDPMDPSIFVDINYLSGLPVSDIENYTMERASLIDWDQSGKFCQRYGERLINPTVYEGPFVKSNILASFPYIHVVQDPADMSLHYQLEFMNSR